MNFFNLKALTVIGGLLLGSIFLGSTPDSVQGTEESSLMKEEHKTFLRDLDAKQKRLQSQVEETMGEHQRMKADILRQQEELKDRQEAYKASWKNSEAEIASKQAQLEALKDEKPRIGDVEW